MESEDYTKQKNNNRIKLKFGFVCAVCREAYIVAWVAKHCPIEVGLFDGHDSIAVQFLYGYGLLFRRIFGAQAFQFFLVNKKSLKKDTWNL